MQRLGPYELSQVAQSLGPIELSQVETAQRLGPLDLSQVAQHNKLPSGANSARRVGK